MQPIVVAVDFSNTSIHCIEYAISLANRIRSDIILIWVDKISMQESLYPDTSLENRNEANKRFEDLVRQFGKKISKGLKIDYKLRKGKIYHEIDALVTNSGACLLVAGAHGISGFEEYWIGSNAFKIVTYSSVPVITVRYDFPIKKSIDTILVPIDNSAETLQKLPIVANIAGYFRSTVHIVTAHSTNLKAIKRLAEKYALQAAQYLEKKKINYIQEEIISNDITKTMITHSLAINADLISIMTEQETPLNILMGPHAQQLINRSPIPILSIHPEEHFYL